MKNTERFSNRVENYIRFRPHYPKEIIPFLKGSIGLESGWKIADIGSGTGISSELFLQNGNRVYAVEPNIEMRKSAERLFYNDKKFISVNGTAESTTLPDVSVELIIAGQAFHWFDKKASKVEFKRIAAPGGFLVLMWNDREIGKSNFLQKYENLLLRYASNYEEICQRQVDEEVICNFFAPSSYSHKAFANVQFFDFEGLKGRLLSCSYAPLESDVNYIPLMDGLRKLFDEENVSGKIAFEYTCKLYYGCMGAQSD